MTRTHRLVAVAVVLAAGLAVLTWPTSEDIPGKRLDAAQILALPDTAVVTTVTARLSQRAGSSLAGWRRLTEAGRQVYAVGAFLTACDKYTLSDQANASAVFPDAPSFADCAEALRGVGATAVAGLLDEAATQARNQAEALQAWQAYRSGAEPGGKAPPDPLAAIDARLRQVLAAAGLDAALCAFIRAHAEELADP